MKIRTLMICIFTFVVTSQACDYDCREKLERIANSLEQIVIMMQKNHNSKIVVREQLPPKCVNGRSLKAEPTTSELEEPELSCIDKCKNDNYSNYTIADCIKKKCI